MYIVFAIFYLLLKQCHLFLFEISESWRLCRWYWLRSCNISIAVAGCYLGVGEELGWRCARGGWRWWGLVSCLVTACVHHSARPRNTTPASTPGQPRHTTLNVPHTSSQQVNIQMSSWQWMSSLIYPDDVMCRYFGAVLPCLTLDARYSGWDSIQPAPSAADSAHQCRSAGA